MLYLNSKQPKENDIMTNYYLTVGAGSGSGYKTAGQVCSITANTPATGYHFIYWSGPGQGYVGSTISSSTTLTMPAAATSITAYYAINYYTIQFRTSPSYGGTITGPIDQSVYYGGQTSPVTAVPNAGWTFTGWSIAGGNPLVITVTSNGTICANFVENANPTYTLVVTNGTGDGSYESGTIVNIVANAPAPANHFTYWSGDTTGIDNVNAASTHIHTQGSNATIVANYAEDIIGFDLVYTAGFGGTIVGTAVQIVPSGDDGTEVIATPITGYYFVTWDDANTTAARTETNVLADQSYVATFAYIPTGYIA